jgi:murein DD-endopeptidase MepM/ murein hydrolase activator NlpD
MLILQIIVWVLVTLALAGTLTRISKHDKITPFACSLALFASFLVFLPTFHLTFLQETKPFWLTLSKVEQLDTLQGINQLGALAFSFDLNQLIIALLLGGSVLRVGRLMQRYHKAKQLFNVATPYQHGAQACLLFPTNQSPFVLGFRNPRIALPRYFLCLDDKAQATILNHEQIHIKNRDHIAMWCWQLLQELAWFNPAMKTFKRLYINAIEQRCDAQTIRALSLSPMEYANTLITSLKLAQTTPFQEHYAQFSSQQMTLDDHKQRLTHIIAQSPLKKTKINAVIIVGAVTISVCSQFMGNISMLQESWRYPVEHISVSSHFGHISEVRQNKAHGGIDLVDTKGSAILAAKSGTVLIADWQRLPVRYGKTIVIQHSDGWQSLYAHLDDFKVKPGQWVKQGDIIGTMGDTGKVTGTHLHFELAQHGERKDPYPYLSRK